MTILTDILMFFMFALLLYCGGYCLHLVLIYWHWIRNRLTEGTGEESWTFYLRIAGFGFIRVIGWQVFIFLLYWIGGILAQLFIIQFGTQAWLDNFWLIAMECGVLPNFMVTLMIVFIPFHIANYVINQFIKHNYLERAGRREVMQYKVTRMTWYRRHIYDYGQETLTVTITSN